MTKRSIAIASLIFLLASSGPATAAEYSPSAQIGLSWQFGAQAPHTVGQSSVTYSLGYASVSRDLSTTEVASDGEPLRDGRLRLRMLPVMNGRWSASPSLSEFRLAGFAVNPAKGSSLASTEGEPDWWGRNWGWVAVSAIVAGTVVAVEALNSGDGVNAPEGGQCEITVIGSAPTNTSGC